MVATCALASWLTVIDEVWPAMLAPGSALAETMPVLELTGCVVSVPPVDRLFSALAKVAIVFFSVVTLEICAVSVSPC